MDWHCPHKNPYSLFRIHFNLFNRIHFKLILLALNFLLTLNCFKWQQRDANPQPLNWWMNTQPFRQTSLAKWLSIHLPAKWFWVRISLLSFKFQMWGLLQARSSLTFRQTIQHGFTLKLAHNMIITYSH